MIKPGLFVITPTIGRVVWYWPEADKRGAQPLPAIIAYVHADNLVNLAVFDANGKASSRTGVLLYQPSDAEVGPPQTQFCEWMPYQLSQAAKELRPVERQWIDHKVGPMG